MRIFVSRLCSTLAVLSVLLAAVPPRAARAGATIVVNGDTEPTGLLSVVPDGKCTLREAVKNANGDAQYTGADCAAGSGADTITFAATYTITLSLGELLISSPITIQESTVNYTTLQASTCNPVSPSGCTRATWRVFEVAPTGSLTLDHIRVTFGNCAGACPTAGDAGGGILVNHGSLTLLDSSVVINSAAYGGGIYNGGGTIAMSNPGSLQRSTVVGNAVTADGGGIYNDGGSLTMSNTEVNGNKAGTTGYGGGAFVSGGSTTLTSVTLLQNTARQGGGMYFRNAGGTLTDVLFQQNSSTSLSGAGGGLYNEQSSPAVQNSTFYLNRSVAGAAIYNLNSSPSIGGTNFLSNTAPNGGKAGAIYNQGSNPSLTNVAFRGNEAGESGAGGKGGAMYNDASSPTLQRVMFYSNHATGDGGGMFNASGSAPALTNVTFSANAADISGGGMHSYASNPTLTNVTFSGNLAPAGAGMQNGVSFPTLKNVILWGDYGGGPEVTNVLSGPTIQNSVVQGGCPTGASCSNLVTADPILGTLPVTPAAGDTFALGAGTSALDAGTNTGCPSTDQRGVARPQGTTCDIGAYEEDYFSISGNAGIAGVSLGYVSGGAQSVTANGSGYYSLDVPRHWTGTVTPLLSSYAFSPSSRSYSDVGTNQTAQNYSAALVAFTISGSAGVAYASLSYPNGSGGTLTAYADVDGKYSFTVPMHWSGTVTPFKFNCTFSPTDKTYDDVVANAPGQDYSPTCGPSAYLIAGNAGTPDAVINYGMPQPVTADSNGNYALYVPAGWTGTVTPSKPGCTFTPAQRTYSSFVNSDMLSENYQATCRAPGYAISGNAGAPGVLLSYIDGAPQTATADAGGKYSIILPPHWSGSVTPSKPGCTFLPLNRSYSDVVSDMLFEDFIATCFPPAVLISGNAGTPGAVLNYDDGGPKSVTADASGSYGFFVPQHWSGNVGALKAGCLFTPPSRTYNDVLFNMPAQNYTANCFSFLISGNAGVAEVTLSYNTGSPQTATTDSSGNYAFQVPAHWNGSVTPTRAGCTFAPSQRTYTDVTADKPVEDYAPSCVFTISGNAGIAGASLDYYDSGAKAAIADGNGDYAFDVPFNWSGTVIPSLTGYTFAPDQRTYADVKEAQAGQDYSASSIPLSISGNAGVASPQFSISSGGSLSESAENGDYAVTVPYGWSGTVTPTMPGCTFTPVDRAYSSIVGDQSGEDYSAACGPASVLITGNAGIGGATISYDNGGPKSVVADPDGSYGFTVPSGWSGTVTPSKLNYSFTPVARSYTSLTADTSAQDYAATPHMSGLLEAFPGENSSTCLTPVIGARLLLSDATRTAAGGFDVSKVNFRLDGTDITAASRVRVTQSQPANHATLLYTPPSALTLGAHTASLTYDTPGGPLTADWGFTVTSDPCGVGTQELSASVASAPTTRQTLTAGAPGAEPSASAAVVAVPAAEQHEAMTAHGSHSKPAKPAAEAQAWTPGGAQAMPESAPPQITAPPRPWTGSFPGCASLGWGCPQTIILKK